MANIPIAGQVLLAKQTPSIDARYGPYRNVEEAFATLGPDNMDVLCFGLVVGIKQSDGNIKEYVITRIGSELQTDITVDNFKERFSSNSGNSSIYKGITETEEDVAIKIATVDSFKIDSEGKPNDNTELILTFVNGNNAQAISININNLGTIPVYYNGEPFSGYLNEKYYAHLIYSKSDNIWMLLNNISTGSVYWT